MKSGDILTLFHSCSFTVSFVKVILISLQFSVTLKAHTCNKCLYLLHKAPNILIFGYIYIQILVCT